MKYWHLVKDGHFHVEKLLQNFSAVSIVVQAFSAMKNFFESVSHKICGQFMHAKFLVSQLARVNLQRRDGYFSALPFKYDIELIFPGTIRFVQEIQV